MDTIRRVEELSYVKGISLAQLARMSEFFDTSDCRISGS